MRTHAANYVEVQTSEETSATGLTFTFASTGAFPAVPFYAALSRTSDTRREVVKFTTKTATTLQCASLGDRYLEGSVAASGIVHPAGTPVLVAPFGQHLSDLWGAIEAIRASDATPTQVTAASQPGAAGTSANFARGDHTHPSGAFAPDPHNHAEQGFRAHRSTNQSLAAATHTKIIFDTETRDDGGNYDPVTGLYTAPATDWYDIAAGVSFGVLSAGERVIVSVYVNGVEDARAGDQTSGGTSAAWAISVSLPLYLTAGQTVGIFAWRANAGAVNGQAALTYFTGKRRL